MLRISHPRVLAIGAHPDDVELGAAGLIRTLLCKHDATVRFLILSTGMQSRQVGRPYEAAVRMHESIEAARALGVDAACVDVRTFPDCAMHEHLHEIIRAIEELVPQSGATPPFDIVLTHARDDLHADHTAVHEATLSALRDFAGTILHYQAPSTKLNGFRPSFFVPLDEDAIAAKELALRAHVSQREKWFMADGRARDLGSSWALFLRRGPGVCLEAFEVGRSFL